MSLPLPTPGSTAYIPTLMRILAEHPSLQVWSYDPVIFFLLFLSLLVKRGGVIVDVEAGTGRSKGKGLDRVVKSVCTTCESIFGLRVSCISIDPAAAPQDLEELISRGRRTEPPPSKAIQNGSDFHTRTSSSGYTLSSFPRSPSLRQTDGVTGASENQESRKLAEDADSDQWPDVLIVTGLEDCGSPVQYKLIELVKRASRERKGAGQDAQDIMLVWVRREEASDSVPSWLADHFILRDRVWAEDIDMPPLIERQALIPPSYIADMASLLPYTHIHPPLTQHLNNLISATSTHPNLHSALTARFLTTLPILVKAHRLLSAPFQLPTDWSDNLSRLSHPEQGENERFGLGGGAGGVNGWARRAGEEPDLAELGDDGEEWFVDPSNIKGVWSTAVRHRVRWRGADESVMWNIQMSAAGLVQGTDKHLSEGKRRRWAKKHREEVDDILDDMIKRLL